MSQISVEFHPASIEEAEAAVLWYAERSVRAAERFIEALEEAVAVIVQAPDRWPCFEDDTRRILLRRYPYVLIYYPITLRYSRLRITVAVQATGEPEQISDYRDVSLKP